MKIKFILTFIFIQTLCISTSDAQNFFPLPPGFYFEVRGIYFDSTLNTLFAGGSFYQNFNHVAAWDGNSWQALGSGINGNVYDFVRYQNMILAGGAFDIAGGITSKGIAVWNGTAWQYFADATNTYGCVFNLLVNGNDLYAGGCFDTINGMAAQGIARYDGTQWHSYPALDPVNIAFVSDITFYNNELYVAGNFNAGPGLRGIVKYDGTNWVSVGGGMANLNSVVQQMVVFQGELYAVGYFFTATGDPGNCIAKWNGTSWSTLGSGLNAGGQLFTITAFKNEIYVGGNFFTISGVSSPFIAKWNGSNWLSLGSTFSNGVMCFSAHNNDLYIGGGFDLVGIDTMNSITRYSPPLGVEENTWNTSGITILPNPNNGNFSLTSLFYPIESIRLFDLSGRVVFLKDKILENTFECKLNTPDGIYIAEVFVNGNVYRKKIAVTD